MLIKSNDRSHPGRDRQFVEVLAFRFLGRQIRHPADLVPPAIPELDRSSAAGTWQLAKVSRNAFASSAQVNLSKSTTKSQHVSSINKG